MQIGAIFTLRLDAGLRHDTTIETRVFYYYITACIGLSLHKKEIWKGKLKRDFAGVFQVIPVFHALHSYGYNGVLNQ